MLEHSPEEFLGHLAGANFVGVGKIVAAGRGGPPQTGQRTRMQAQRITHIIEPDAVSQLRVEKANYMAPRTEGADLLFYSSFPSELGNQKIRNEVADLPQQIQFRRRWNDLVFLFHPCRVAGLNNSFQLFLHFLWDGCGENSI